MQHQPNILILIETYLDEVIAASKSSDLPPDSRFIKSTNPRTNRQLIEARVKLVDFSIKRERLETTVVIHLRRRLVEVEPYRHIAFDLRPNSRKIVGKIRCRQVQLDRNHSAADIDANRRRNDGGP